MSKSKVGTANAVKEEAKPSQKYIHNNNSGLENEALEFHNERQHARLNTVQLNLREAISTKKLEIVAGKLASEPQFRSIYKLQTELELLQRELAFHNKLEKELF